MSAPFVALFTLLGTYPYPSIAICAAATVLSYLVGWGDGIALFACAGSAVLVWKVEADHLAPVEMGQGTAA